VSLTQADNGIKLQLHDPNLVDALNAPEDVMDENCAMLQALTGVNQSGLQVP
jgi:hypothetical protein